MVVYDGDCAMNAPPALPPLLALLVLLLAPSVLPAQSLVGTWVSTEPILLTIKFSLTFSDAEYVIDCTLGQTVGTYIATEDQIVFTPVKVGINSGDVGKADTWTFRFVDADSFFLSSGAISVRLFRKS